MGVIRPDLAERLLPLRLERPRIRRTEAELWAEYAEVLPVVLGSLLDLTVKVRAAEAETPTDLRMADFAHLCAQLDAATGLGALNAYRASLDDLNDDVIEGDLLAQTVLLHAESLDPGARAADDLHGVAALPQPPLQRRGLPPPARRAGRPPARSSPTVSSASSPPFAARGVLIDTGRTSEGRYLEMTRPAGPPPPEQQQAF